LNQGRGRLVIAEIAETVIAEIGKAGLTADGTRIRSRAERQTLIADQH
jgi:hypothetical protein